MKFRVIPYRETLFENWNDFVQRSNEGTLFHRLDFLAYHRDRFSENEHHLQVLKGDSFFGVMPMAVFRENGRAVARSPYGASYGGPVFLKPPNYNESRQIINAIISYLEVKEIVGLDMTLPISACYREYCETFRLALMERGFQCVNRDISSAVFLGGNRPVWERLSSRARNMARKAQKADIDIIKEASTGAFWDVLVATLQKHHSKPTHSKKEFEWLNQTIPGSVYVDVAYMEKKPIAGIGYFVINDRVNSSFYLAQDPAYQEHQALSLLIQEALVSCQKQGIAWFDFGTSSMKMEGRANIFKFKESFGAIGMFRETYRWKQSE